MRALRILLPLLCVAGSAIAAPDALKAHKSETRRIEKEAGRYWRDFQGRFQEGYLAFREPLEQADANPGKFPEANYDYSAFRGLYDEYVNIQRALGEADLRLAEAGGPKALAHLLDSLLQLCKQSDKLDKEIREARPKSRSIFDQRPVVERHGLATRRAMLIEALGKCEGAAEALATDGWKKATRSDGKRGVTYRVAILDALAGCGEAGRPLLTEQLGSQLSSLRIAAIEALAAGPATEEMAVQLRCEKAVVRRALLQELARADKVDPKWIEILVPFMNDAPGSDLEPCLRILAKATRQKFGNDPKAWREWLDEYRSEIGSGNFDPESVEVREATPVPVPDRVKFYGLEVPTEAFVFVVEGSIRLAVPADVDVQRTKIRWDWKGTRRQWEEESPAHQTILLDQLAACLGAAPEDTFFGLILLQARFTLDFLNEKKLVPLNKKNRRAALEMIEKAPASGWCSPNEGIRNAAALGGFDPESDTDFPNGRLDAIFFVNSGDPAGGRYLTPESLVAAFQRFNRFRRITVHALRICNAKEPGEVVMKGLAENSGGRYVWLAKPPTE